MKEALDKYAETLKSVIPVVQTVSWGDKRVTHFSARKVSAFANSVRGYPSPRVRAATRSLKLLARLLPWMTWLLLVLPTAPLPTDQSSYCTRHT